jgi:acyl-CoA thioester hydrolase
MAITPSTLPADYHYVHPIRVRFAETDAMGVVHHAAYLPYLEEARVAFLRDIDHPYASVRDVEGIDFTVLEVFVRYLQPLRFDDVVDVHLTVGAVTRATFQLGYLLAKDGTAHATAVTVHGCVTADGKPTRPPPWLVAEADDVINSSKASSAPRR